MSPESGNKKPKRKRDKPVSLHPLGFEEAVSDLLKVKPGAKVKRPKPKRKRPKDTV